MRIALLFLLFASAAPAQDDVGVPGKIVECDLPPVKKRGERVEYAIYLPRAYKKDKPAPLVLAVHGGRATGAKMASFLKPMAERQGAILACPQAFEEFMIGGGRWWRGDKEERAALSAVLAHVKKTYSVDPSRVSVIGLADGGETAFKWAMMKDRGLSGFVMLNMLYKKPSQSRAKKTMKIYVAASEEAFEKTEKLADHAKRAHQGLRMMRYPIVLRLHKGRSNSFFHGWEEEFHKAFEWFSGKRNWPKELARASVPPTKK